MQNQIDQMRKEHILVCLSSSPSNAHIIRTAAAMAEAFQADFTAVYVETTEFHGQAEGDRKRLQDNIDFAKSCGARIEKMYGDDIPYQISRYAKLSMVTRIIIGQSIKKNQLFFWKKDLSERLLSYAPELDIYVIPDSEMMNTSSFWKRRNSGEENQEKNFLLTVKDLLISILILALGTGFALLFAGFGLSDANIIPLYILSVLLVAVTTTSYSYCFISSLAAVIIFNFFFTDPKYTLLAYDAGYPVTFVIMFIVSLIAGNLASRLKATALRNEEVAYRTKILFDTSQLIARAEGSKEITAVTANQLAKLLMKPVILYPSEEEKLGSAELFGNKSEESPELYQSEQDLLARNYTYEKRKSSGAKTENFSEARCKYWSIHSNNYSFGVIGIDQNGKGTDPVESSAILTILGECALALENEKNAREKEAANLQAQNEQIRANLVRAISHDLRTPLTTISGNASNLIVNSGSFDETTRKQIYLDIYDDSLWLNSLVENLLSISRIENGTIRLRMTTELLEECIQEALKHLDRNSANHHIEVEFPEEVILVRVEARLIVQLLINLVGNAVKYTPEGSHIRIKLYTGEDKAYVAVSDDGPGISDEDKAHIFEMFYTGKKKVADSKRSLGLGLALCKSIVTAHGGQIWVEDAQPVGSRFTFSLPILKREVD